MNDYLVALFLGFIEGLTEYIPVSSTGHLILLIEGLNFPSPPGRVFEVFIQIGAILAVMVLYREKIFRTICGIPNDKTAQRFALNIIIGTIPALIIGAMLHDFIKQVLYSPMIIAASLIIGAIIILLFDKKFDSPRVENIDDISPKQALAIGFCQSIALIPGVSRSGATIMGSLALGLSRGAATEFSFFLAMPVMFCAVAYDLYKNWDAIADSSDYMGLMLTGLAGAFVTALFVVKTVVGFVSRHGFAPFAYYRIALGLAALVIFW
ncbi:MAG: undecaprenyl-diphosphatase [Micavibrio aeruginosavorus]|uniref:Undecaprenyl-diphosphatase n=1 Tax=Micavibrio aeruginosavorus TaxID=349221 RepID=A0A2W5MVC8_9BACT|nr:MAG: undecaprenyl-diphosphatase [Micavibrio aeruginosavorus]